MRDPEHIARIIAKLELAWKLVPDWRLGQLISNLQGPGVFDAFYTEDQDWERWLDALIAENASLTRISDSE